MMPRQHKNILLLITMFCVVLSVIFTASLTAAEHNHNCTGEDCPICLLIEAAQSFLRNLKFAGIAFVLSVCLLFFTRSIIKNAVLIFYHLSPVTLKVRFNS